MIRRWIDRIIFWSLIAVWFATTYYLGPLIAAWVIIMNGADTY